MVTESERIWAEAARVRQEEMPIIRRRAARTSDTYGTGLIVRFFSRFCK